MSELQVEKEKPGVRVFSFILQILALVLIAQLIPVFFAEPEEEINEREIVLEANSLSEIKPNELPISENTKKKIEFMIE